ncbi:MAG: choice-of-anchor A family protein, partial [Oscillospiraceae bacterium]|nr:choice-of-anchor A family protein [Oscillospiraceae bacterium]
MKKSFKKRLLSGVTSALLAVSSAIPNVSSLSSSLPLTASAAVQNPVKNIAGKDVDQMCNYAGNGAYGPYFVDYTCPGELSESDLLVGSGSKLAADDGSAAKAIQNARDMYLLGIASQFSVFLDTDFTATAGDAEGRVAVGGDLRYVIADDAGTEKAPTYNYQVGNGDYATMTALKNTSEYTGTENFAHAIVGGRVRYMNTVSGSDSNGGRTDQLRYSASANSFFYPPDEDLFKRFVVQGEDSFENSRHIAWPPSKGYAPTVAPYGDDVEDNEKHDYWQVNEKGQFYDASEKPLIDFADIFKRLRAKSTSLAEITATGESSWSSDGKVLTLNYTGSPTKTIYFTLDEWNDNITEVVIDGNLTGEENYVISYKGTDTEISIGKLDSSGNGGTVKTTVNGVEISNTGDNKSNNNAVSSQILY